MLVYLIAERWSSWYLKPELTLKENFYILLNKYKKIGSMRSFDVETSVSIYVKNFIVTPSIVKFKAPIKGRSNRVVRKYFDERENFIWVNFWSDEMDRGLYGLSSGGKDMNSLMLKHIESFMKDGVKVRDK